MIRGDVTCARSSLKRLALLVPILFGVATLTFILMYVVPGDPVRALAGERYDEETLARMRTELGLDRPLVVQYVDFLGRLARFDLGTVLRDAAPRRRGDTRAVSENARARPERDGHRDRGRNRDRGGRRLGRGAPSLRGYS